VKRPLHEIETVRPLLGAMHELLHNPDREINKAAAMLQAHAASVIALLLEVKTPAELRALIASEGGKS
jgi:hypothetical protein